MLLLNFNCWLNLGNVKILAQDFQARKQIFQFKRAVEELAGRYNNIGGT